MNIALPRDVRFAVFVQRLRDAKAVESREAAIQLVRLKLNEVEDEYSGVPNDPDSFATDGRMYPPQDDAKRLVPERDELTRYRTRGHNVYVSDNGAISIFECRGGDMRHSVVIEKSGVDGHVIKWK